MLSADYGQHWIGATGVFRPRLIINNARVAAGTSKTYTGSTDGFRIYNSRQTPTDDTNHPATVSVMQLLRIAGDITGKLEHNGVQPYHKNNGEKGYGALSIYEKETHTTQGLAGGNNYFPGFGLGLCLYNLKTSLVVPATVEVVPVMQTTIILIRTAGDISGEVPSGVEKTDEPTTGPRTSKGALWRELKGTEVHAFTSGKNAHEGQLIKIESARVIPSAIENTPVATSISIQIRLRGDIRGTLNIYSSDPEHAGGAFKASPYDQEPRLYWNGSDKMYRGNVGFRSAFVIPKAHENRPSTCVNLFLLRIVGDITGKWQNQDGFGPIITSSYFGHIPPSGAYKIGGSLPYADQGVINDLTSHQLIFDSSLVVPSTSESFPVTLTMMYLIRLIGDITGDFWNNRTNYSFLTGAFYKQKTGTIKSGYSNDGAGQTIYFDSSCVVPSSKENIAIEFPVVCLIRLLGDISGNTGFVSSLSVPPVILDTYPSGFFGYKKQAGSLNGIVGASFAFREYILNARAGNVVPIAEENRSLNAATILMIRISGDITGTGHVGPMELERYRGAFKRPNLYINASGGDIWGLYCTSDSKETTFAASLVVPTSFEINPANQSILCLLRIAGDITGWHMRDNDNNGTIWDDLERNSGCLYPGGNKQSNGLPYNYQLGLRGPTASRLCVDSSRVVPLSHECIPATFASLWLIRVLGDIRGNLAAVCNGGPSGTAIWNQLQTNTNGAFFFKNDVRKEYRARTDYNPNEAKAPLRVSLESSKTTPSNQEVVSSFLTIKQLLRIAGDITGELVNFISTGRQGTGAFRTTQDNTRYAFSRGDNCYYSTIKFNSSRVVSSGFEVKPFTYVIFPLLRILGADSLQSQLQGYFRKNKGQF